ncbi:MAG: DUF4093 domain-containing protein [Oscillospiraceae bacterium]|nr:DUF4093 domain-containing protein [Oscillospiraceae bacterium]
MIKIKQAIIVEGRYDKITLSNLVDAVIIPTNGFSIYKDAETAELIKLFARTTGVIILTDSDSAGFQIRGRLKSIIGGKNITNVFIPEIYGKEKRKRKYSKQGLLGVEGMTKEVLLDAFSRAGVFAEEGEENADPITKADLLDLGLCGGENSSKLRVRLQQKLGLPSRLSANMLLEAANAMYTREEFLNITTKILGELK